MRTRWRIVLPVVGLLLLVGETYHSVRTNREVQRSPSRYFWWSFLRLDSDPLNKHPQFATPCKPGEENCVSWDLPNMWVDPGWFTRALMVSALPALLVSVSIASGLGRLGINQIWSFMISMPLLLSAW